MASRSGDADDVVKRLLEYLEPKVDPCHVRKVADLHRAALTYDRVDRLPVVCYLPYEGKTFLPYPIQEAFHDPAKMMVNELLTGFTSIYHAVDLKDDSPYTLRPNLGVTVVASLFGASVRLLENEMPWITPFEGGLDDLRKILLESPPPTPHSGLAPRVVEQYGYFDAALCGFPNCKAAFQLTLPDLQGPFSTLELLCGSAIYTEFYEHPEQIVPMLDRIADATAMLHTSFKGMAHENLGPDAHYCHAVGVKGRYLLRNDSVINISPEHYRRFVQPVDGRLASAVGGMGVHFCGAGQHQIDNFLSMPDVVSLDLGQPERIDLDRVYRKAAARKVPLLRISVPESESAADQVSRRFPSGAIMVYRPKTIAEAESFLGRYLRNNFRH